MTIAQALWGVSNAVLLFAVMGTFWLGLGLGPASYRVGIAPWIAVLAVMAGGLIALTYKAVAIRRRAAFRRSDLRRSDPATRCILAGLRVIGAIEALLVIGAVWLCNYLQRPDLVVPAIALAVSIHFAPLAHLLSVPAYYVTAAAGTLVSAAAMLAPLAGSRPIWLGTGMAIVMWATAIYLVREADAIAAACVASSRAAVASPE